MEKNIKIGILILKGISYLIYEFQDGWVAVDEHSGEKGDWAIHKGEIVKVTDDNHMLSSYGYKRIIAQSPNLSLEGVMKVEIGISRYYEILATEKLGREVLISGGLKKPTDLAVQYWSEGYLYKAAQQRGMFTEEQVIEAIEMARETKNYGNSYVHKEREILDSLLPKYEVEMLGCRYSKCDCASNSECFEMSTFEKNGETIVKAKLIN